MPDGPIQASLGPTIRPAGRRTAAKRWPATPVVPLLVVVWLLLAVSGGLLWLIGLNYDGMQGSAAAKIHPSTYLMVLLFGMMALRSGNPVGYLAHLLERRPAAMLLLAVTFVMLTSIALRGAPGLAGTLDTYVGASLIVLLLVDADERSGVRIARAVHLLLALNALLGLFEFLSGHQLFPYRFDGDVFPEDHRATALQGHPLTNATITSTYLVALVSGARLTLPPVWRLPMIGLQLAALVAFGGRSGLVVALLFGAVLGAVRLHGVMRRGRVPLLGVVAATLLLTLIPLAICGLAAAGFFDAIADRFASDGGSAYARVQMFELFDRIPFRDLLVGPDPAYVDSIRRITGLEWGIENPVIRTLLYQGLMLTTVMTIAVVAYFFELARITGPGTLAPILAFAFLINTSESIGGKTTMLTKFAVLLIALYPNARRRSAGRELEAERR